MKILTIFFISLLALQSAAPEDPLQEFLKKVEQHRKAFPQEKVHMHTDKAWYNPGDTVWFKAYMVNAAYHKLPAVSQVLHVALLNEKNQLERSLAISAPFGLGQGEIALPDSLDTGEYTLYAYTRWMRNFTDDVLFTKKIHIVNGSDSLAAKPDGRQPAASAGPDVQFFPEGGWLVNGLRSKVGFKVTGEDGLGRNLGGRIVDQDNNEVATFLPDHGGMGVFALQPRPGSIYTAIVSTGSSEKQFILPQAKENGYVLNVNHAGEDLSVSIGAVPSLIGTSIILLAQSTDGIGYVATTRVDEATVRTKIPKSRFNTGVVQVSVLSADLVPLCQRLVFIDHHDRLGIAAMTDKSSYRAREKTSIGISVTDHQGNPVSGSYSIAVTTGEVPYNPEKEPGIVSQILLSSDLKGHIEDPEYYFLDTTVLRERHLDHLMLTQGWRRFAWKDLDRDGDKVFAYQAEQGIEIAGTITTPGGKPVPGAAVKLFSSDSTGVFFLDTLADENGRFRFERLTFPDGAQFRLQASTAKGGKNVDILLDSSEHVKPSPATHEGAPYDDAGREFSESSEQREAARSRIATALATALRDGVTLKEVKIRSRSLDPVAFRQAFADKVATNEKLMKFSGLSTGLAVLMPGVSFGSDGKVFLSRRGMRVPLQVWVDGIMADDYLLTTLTPEMVESAELLSNGSNSLLYGGPALMIYRKKDYSTGPAPGTLTFQAAGFHTPAEFYSPRYSVTDALRQDLRTTVFWSPNLVPDENGKATIEFHNADYTGDYRIVIEGTDGKGRFGRYIKLYRVTGK